MRLKAQNYARFIDNGIKERKRTDSENTIYRVIKRVKTRKRIIKYSVGKVINYN